MKNLKRFELGITKEEKSKKAEDLFVSIFSNLKLKPKCWIVYPTNIPKYEFVISIKENISTGNYKDFYKIFDFLSNLDIFSKINDSKQLLFETYNIDTLIKELEILNKSQQYNL